MNIQEIIEYLKGTQNSWAVFDKSGQCWLGKGFPCCTPGYTHRIESYETFNKVIRQGKVPRVEKDLYSFYREEMEAYHNKGTWESMGVPKPGDWTGPGLKGSWDDKTGWTITSIPRN